ncbi:MAG: alpha/beta hydrolase [Planctomycetia bacterium]|nr:alpha/beta hydrolase [Planctomycetia bacterium]
MPRLSTATRTSRLATLALCLSGALATASSRASAAGPDPLPLWPEGAPGAVGDEERDKPGVRVYLPEKEKATGCGIVVLPGGGYAVLAMDHEGHQVAKWLNSVGVAAFVVNYRLGPRYRHPAPLEDAQRAVRFVRSKAEEFGVSPKRIGIMGFSAGGHLASTVATHFDGGKSDAKDPIDRASCRPDFAVLCYPVVSLTEPFSHKGSLKNLVGDNPDPKLLELLSNEKHVTGETPPTFLFHTSEDKGVPVENSLTFYAALRKAGVPAELHVYAHGPHGVGLAPGDPALSTWKERLYDWLKGSGFLADVKRAAVKGKVVVDGVPLRWGAIGFVPEKASEPVAWAMISQGNYSISASRGPVLGKNGVVIQNLGSVEPRPTIEDAVEITHRALVVDVVEDADLGTFDVGQLLRETM